MKFDEIKQFQVFGFDGLFLHFAFTCLCGGQKLNLTLIKDSEKT